MREAQSAVSEMLLDWRSGDPRALERLTPIVYGELRRLAQHYMNHERADHMLQATALVHEAYLRLVGLDLDWHGRSHFFAVAARLMRRVLVDIARHDNAAKRGGPELTISLEDCDVAIDRAERLTALDDALTALSALDERKARVVELRFFGGLTIAETAEVLEISHATVERDAKLAKAWLTREMGAP